MGAILAILGESDDPELGQRLRRMLARSLHRGESKILVEGPLAIAVQSLGSDASLADVGNWQVAFHGYIGNWDELAAGRGWRFEEDATNADKVVVAFDDLGDHLFAKLRGEWAALIWNRRERTLLAARDVIGCRPLFVHRHGGRLYLATEVRQVLAGSGAPVEIDLETFRKFLHGEPNPDRSSIDGVSQVPAGTVWASDADSGGPQPEQFFRFGSEWRELSALGLHEAAEVVRSRLERAVSRTLADRPMCIALSGGLDSSVLWGFVSSLHSEEIARPDIAALCLRYPGRNDDEGDFMDAVLDRWPGPRTDIQLHPHVVMPCLEDAAARADTPYLANIVGQLELARGAEHEGRRIILSGHGGDLAFQGHFLDLERAVLRKRQPTAVWWTVRLAVRQGMMGGAFRQLIRRLTRRTTSMSRFSEQSGEVSASGNLSAEARALWGGDGVATGEAGRRSMLEELAVERAGGVLTPWEQVSASFGVETRHPLLDLDLLEAALSVPQMLHLSHGFRKGLLRLAARSYLPEKVRSRRGKMSLTGFIREGLESGSCGPLDANKEISGGMEEVAAGFDDEFVLPLRLLVADLLRHSGSR
jgi:asparagine synthase (glutamine-hydrolysing)